MLKGIAQQINAETPIFAIVTDEHIHLQYGCFEFELGIEDNGDWTIYTEAFGVDIDSGKRVNNAVFKILDVIEEYCVSCY